MKYSYLCFGLTLFAAEAAAQGKLPVVTQDITNFWKAYDKIISTPDSAQQYAYLNTLFIEPGSPGLRAIMQVRGYTAADYIQAIAGYPRFWQSVRPNTLRAAALGQRGQAALRKLYVLYPEAKPATTYFTIGALRTGGTTAGNMVLIGSETLLADKTTVTEEFGPKLAHLPPHFRERSDAEIIFTNVHEFVHTQQKTTAATTLLGQCLLEGVAEFVTVLTTGRPSTLPALRVGSAQATKIQARFASQLLNSFTGFWLYSNDPNEFATRDLGYYVGYAICEKYYVRAADKKRAIKAMIELDYNDERAMQQLVDESGYFNRTFAQLKRDFEQNRPEVVGIDQFSNGQQVVNPQFSTITLRFSVPMDPNHRNFELGPLGFPNLLRLGKLVGFSADGITATYEIAPLKPGQHYQLLVGENFRSLDGVSLKPYLIDFTTAP
ncbi:hypothetical protein [Hymenobacter sp. 102]|uniref:hypothetical protein n=1 Tax=Hymenobacter sp. 102 TaxID=3403152 RepID=UPI003CEC1A0B